MPSDNIYHLGLIFATRKSVEATMGRRRSETNGTCRAWRWVFICEPLFEGLQTRWSTWHEATLASFLGSLSRLHVAHCNFDFRSSINDIPCVKYLMKGAGPNEHLQGFRVGQVGFDGLFSQFTHAANVCPCCNTSTAKSMVMFLTSAMPAMRSKVKFLTPSSLLFWISLGILLKQIFSPDTIKLPVTSISIPLHTMISCHIISCFSISIWIIMV